MVNPRKADLHRWRETLAEKLRDRGAEADATRRRSRNYDPQWRIKAREDGQLLRPRPERKTGLAANATRAAAAKAWRHIAAALGASADPNERRLSAAVGRHLGAISLSQPLEPAWLLQTTNSETTVQPRDPMR